MLFVTELISTDTTAIGIVVGLVALEPWVGVTGRQAISGFANPATVTIIAMYMLSAGIQNTGVVQRLGVYLAKVTNGSETKALAATVGTTGPIAGFINNTPVVAVFIPMITELAEKTNMSPSKLLLPLSYAAMLGGTLTLIGTSTNILASDFAREALDRGPIGMFEFTSLGIIVLLVGLGYLMTVGRWLTPERIPAGIDLTEEFGVSDHLTRVLVEDASPLIDQPADGIEDQTDLEVDVLQLDRDGEKFVGATTDHAIAAGDVLTVRGTLQEVNRLVEGFGVRQLVRETVTDAEFATDAIENRLAKVVVPPESTFVGESVDETKLREFHGTTVLAIRRRAELLRDDLDDTVLEAGDTLLVQTTDETIGFFGESGDLVLASEPEHSVLEADAEETIGALSPKTPLAIGIMASVVAVAALGWLPIVIAALGGVFAMVVTGCLSTSEAYDAVSWNIIFLLAGVIPLGIAMQETGGAEFLAELIGSTAAVLPVIGVLALLYLLTGLLANVITPVATIVLMLPIAVDTAATIGGNEFAFLLGVTFAAATAFMTPVGYQTNLMVYGPGGYRFTDFVRVGGPLQLLLTVVTVFGISVIWNVS